MQSSPATAHFGMHWSHLLRPVHVRQCRSQTNNHPPFAVTKVSQIALRGGMGGRCPHAAGTHERMAGRDVCGDFKTARAKIYPEGLNQALAQSINSFVCSTFVDVDTASLCCQTALQLLLWRLCTRGSCAARLPRVAMTSFHICRQRPSTISCSTSKVKVCHPSH